MIKKLLLILIALPMIGFGQMHTIDQHNLQMYGNTNDNDISINTYYNALDTCSISWNIIKDSLPSQWEFSICFPNCYVVGIVNSQNLIYPNEQAYLNCHMYANGQSGNGIIQMEITTNNLHKDTVTWLGSISNISSSDPLNVIDFESTQLIKVIDIFGRETKGTKNEVLFYIYNDGTVEKRIVIK
tara:strand:+ start:407 stop:961 length:555 start_codon:yes stop_codon:yes gene_type:complete